MGTFSIPIEVGDGARQRFETVDALVDTVATNTVLPGSLLRGLGVVPYRKSSFQLADGRELEMDVGRTWVRVDGQQEYTQVVFGADDTEPILGAVTLEEMAFAVDPVARRLVPVRKHLA